MIRDGKLDEARQLCEEQTGAALGHLQADPDWRKEYLELWMHQRAPPFRITFDDYDFDGELHTASDDHDADGELRANDTYYLSGHELHATFDDCHIYIVHPPMA